MKLNGWFWVHEIPVYAHSLFLSDLLGELVGFILQPEMEEKWWWSLGGCDWGRFGRGEGWVSTMSLQNRETTRIEFSLSKVEMSQRPGDGL